MIVSPSTHPGVTRATRKAGLVSLPGFFSPTEAFVAMAAGADALKLCPAEAATIERVNAPGAVLSTSAPLLLVGRIEAQSPRRWSGLHVAGFGIDSALFRSGDDAETVAEKARRFVALI